MIVRDDTARTYEVCGKESNDNRFSNRILAMQRAGMNVSFMSPPVTTQTHSRELIKITGYTYEEGLFDKLQRLFLERTLREAGEE